MIKSFLNRNHFINYYKCGKKIKKKQEGGDVEEVDKNEKVDTNEEVSETLYDVPQMNYPPSNQFQIKKLRNSLIMNQNGGFIPFDKCGNKIKKGQRGLAFYRQENKFPKGHAIISETILTPEGKNSDGTWYYPDFQKTLGRNIYVSPNGNDTVYFNYPDSYISYDSGYQPIGNTRNQQQARARFLQLAKKSKSYNKNSAQALGRARKEK